ncbi:dystrobrevin beta-like isoform X1 [Saccostrea echinata]|uniref:dystrobrevin beta-like isoform X1 n=1 Tax=Saccostrea echinata TaxID=191078 RepID=UPI002A825941|nr:dystrobrevin beta-like isoform X1 [Saccostrea echinata]
MASPTFFRGYVHGKNIENENQILEDISPTSKSVRDSKSLLTEMRAQNFDVIRFATYRTACKLRFIQKKTNLSLVDIWNIIESFRENGLNSLEPDSELNSSRVEAIISSLFCNLNKRLPSTQQVNADQCVNMLLHWIISAYDREGYGRMSVFSLKVALSHMCSGKMMDKLRYIFTQISDSSGNMVWTRFEDYLRALLALPAAVFEGPSFGYNETAPRSCFDKNNPVNVNDFLNVMMVDPGPQCLMWLPILSKMPQVENVFHPVLCEGCHRESFMGFRYKCQRCCNFQLCQDCFWRGRTAGNHTNDHQMKEFTAYKSPAKQIGHNLKKTFKCVPNKSTQSKLPQFPETPEKTVDLSYIINLPFEEVMSLLKPPTPQQQQPRNGFHDTLLHQAVNSLQLNGGEPQKSPRKMTASVECVPVDDEHRLIARYAARLAADAENTARSPTELNFSLDSNKAQRELISQLEAKNREIMREIHRLRSEQEAHARSTESAQYNPTLLAELRQLRQRKDELESRMSALQDSRKELMVQLEGLMKLLKTHPTSPRAVPTDSTPHHQNLSQSLPDRYAAPNIPTTPAMESSMLAGVGGEVRQAFYNPGPVENVRLIRNDLMCAADSVTSAMSSLVKELNSEASSSDEDEDNIIKQEANLEMEEAYIVESQDEVDSWQNEILHRMDQDQDFLSQLKARRNRNNNHSDSETDSLPPPSYASVTESATPYYPVSNNNREGTEDGDSFVLMDDNKTDDDAELYDNHPKELPNRLTSSTHTTDDESYLQSDADSYIRTDDDEESSNTDWEESMKRWVNR